MKALDIVKEYFSTATDEQASDVLYMCTNWPNSFIPKQGQNIEDCLREQLKDIAERSQADPEVACQIADKELAEVMRDFKEE